MKKNKKNKISAKKSVKLTKKVENVKVKPKKGKSTEVIKEERKARKKEQKAFEKGIESKKGLSKILISMGGVRKEKASPEDKIKLLEARKKLRKERERLYENRRIAALKRRYKRGEKTPEELKIAIEDLKKTIAETKRYDIIAMFPKPDKEMIREMLTNEKINYTLLSDDYFWIKDTDSHILAKIREIMPSEVKIQPYKAQNTQNKTVQSSKSKKPTNNTTEVRKAAKSKKKQLTIEYFKSRKKRDFDKKRVSTSLMRKIKNMVKITSQAA